MGDDADDLIGGSGAHDEAGIDEKIAAAGNERVQTVVIHDIDFDAAAESRRAEDWCGVTGNDIFHFRIADEPDGTGIGRHGNLPGNDRNKGDKESDDPHDTPSSKERTGSGSHPNRAQHYTLWPVFGT